MDTNKEDKTKDTMIDSRLLEFGGFVLVLSF